MAYNWGMVIIVGAYLIGGILAYLFLQLLRTSEEREERRKNLMFYECRRKD